MRKEIAVLIFYYLLIIYNHSYSQNSAINVNSKINGISLVATKQKLIDSNFESINQLNANWVTLMPFAFMSHNNPLIIFDSDYQWKGETSEGIEESIIICKNQGIKIMLKPHIWVQSGWIGQVNYSTEKEWVEFEKNYTRYILTYAEIAQKHKIELFSIGVELKMAVVSRPKFWATLIDSIRTIYTGKITYAANWDNYKNIVFWSKLDYIGIDAYFPISNKQTPSISNCIEGWKNHKKDIKKISDSYQKQIIFTEFGYRNIDFTGKEPWDEKNNLTFNELAQNNAYTALFEQFWEEPWFIGGFLWKWFPNNQKSGGSKNNRFTPQNKSVINTIQNNYNIDN